MKLARSFFAVFPLLAASAGLASLALSEASCAKANDSSASVNDGCNQQAAAICRKMSDCSQFRLQAVYGDEVTCEGQQKQECLSLLQADGTSRTPDQASTCASALRQQSCDDFVANVVIDGCEAQPGALSPGKACIDNAQCDTAFCKVTSSSAGACGVCGSKMASKSGEVCNATQPCETGLVCTGGTCGAGGTTGYACDETTPCAPNYACMGSGAIGDGGVTKATCVALGTGGASCNQATAPCAEAQGFACDPAAKTCSPITLGASDDDCDNGVFQCSGGTCRASPEAGPEAGPDEPRICIPTAIIGSSCDVVAGPDCMAPAVCINRTCTIKTSAACK